MNAEDGTMASLLVLTEGSLHNISYNVTTETPNDLEIDKMKLSLEEMRFVVQLILVPIVAFIGVFGNVTTIAVLTRKTMRSSTNYYLTALAFSDMMYLIMFFILSISHHPGMNGSHAMFYWQFFKYALWINDASSEYNNTLYIIYRNHCLYVLSVISSTPISKLSL